MYLQFRDWSGVNLLRGFLCGSALAEEFIFITPSELMEYFFCSLSKSHTVYRRSEIRELYAIQSSTMLPLGIQLSMLAPPSLSFYPLYFFYKLIIKIKTSTHPCTLCYVTLRLGLCKSLFCFAC